MQLNRRRIVAPEDGSPIVLYPLGDIHLGASACDVADFRRIVEQIKTEPNAYWLGIGDMGDCIMPSDPRFNARSSALADPENYAYEQLDLIRTELAPIADKCIGLHDGNHETAFRKYYFVDPGKQLSREWGVPFLEYTALTRLDIEIPRGPLAHHRVWTLNVFSEHGATGGGTPGNAVNALQRRGNEFEADIFLKGHVHQRGITSRQLLAWGGKKYLVKDRLFVLTGTFLKGYQVDELTYGERKAYPPNEIGSTAILLDTKHDRIHGVNAETVPLFTRR